MIRELAVLCTLLGFFGPNAQASQPRQADAAPKECPAQLHLGADLWRYTGQYKNGAYGYSTQIPNGLTGLDQKNAFYQKGFAILSLGGGFLAVDAEPNSPLFKASGAAAKENVSELQSEFGPLISTQYRSVTLASRPAVESTVVFHCPGSKESYTDISLFALNPGKRFVYSLTWQGPQTGQALGRKTLESLQQTWKFLIPQ